MLLTIILVLALFLGSRFFLSRWTDPKVSNGAAAGIASAFVLGLITSRALFVGDAGPAPAPSGQGPAAVAEVSVPAHTTVGRDVTSMCRSAKRPASEGSPGNLDAIVPDAGGSAIGDGGVLDRGTAYWVSGWAANSTLDQAATGVCLVVDGHIETGASSYYFVPRPDVAASNHQSGLALSGYTVEILPRTFTPGAHRIRIAARLSDGSFKNVSGFRNISVR
jgi:hypothetical protein